MVITRGWGVGELGRCCLRVQTTSRRISPRDLVHSIVIIVNNAVL